jgi:hypothetical protein
MAKWTYGKARRLDPTGLPDHVMVLAGIGTIEFAGYQLRMVKRFKSPGSACLTLGAD